MPATMMVVRIAVIARRRDDDEDERRPSSGGTVTGVTTSAPTPPRRFRRHPKRVTGEALMTWLRPSSADDLRAERGEVGGDREHVVLGEALDDRRHQRRPRALARALLEVPQL